MSDPVTNLAQSLTKLRGACCFGKALATSLGPRHDQSKEQSWHCSPGSSYIGVGRLQTSSSLPFSRRMGKPKGRGRSCGFPMQDPCSFPLGWDWAGTGSTSGAPAETYSPCPELKGRFLDFGFLALGEWHSHPNFPGLLSPSSVRNSWSFQIWDEELGEKHFTHPMKSFWGLEIFRRKFCPDCTKHQSLKLFPKKLSGKIKELHWNKQQWENQARQTLNVSHRPTNIGPLSCLLFQAGKMKVKFRGWFLIATSFSMMSVYGYVEPLRKTSP